MSQCIQCRKPCAENALCCEACQTGPEKLYQPANGDPNATVPAFFMPENLGGISLPFVDANPPPAEHADAQNVPPLSANSELTASKLRLAALRIEEQSYSKRLRRVSRLAPLPDISTDIQRNSTPSLDNTRHSVFDTQPSQEIYLEQSADPNATDLCPWEKDAAAAPEPDLWADATDPFLARARPTAAEGAGIEAADIQRIQLEEHTTLPYPTVPPARRRFSIWRLIFAGAIILALSALLINGLLLALAFHRTRQAHPSQSGPPTLLLSTSVASAGEAVAVQLLHFTHETNVVLTRDIQQDLSDAASPTPLAINNDGQAATSFTVNSAWGGGFHLIVAEDVTTRDTASALLQVNNAGISRPPHLLLDSSTLDLGSAVQGANTVQALPLRNTGSGSITWSASSDQPWLLAAPLQGTFGSGQTISLAAQRDHLRPGKYQGTITLSSNVGAPMQLHVAMTVTPLPPESGAMISLTPPLLSFTTMDGSAAPMTQVVTLSNPGQQRLSWSLAGGKAVTTMLQSTSRPNSHESTRHAVAGFNLSGAATPWLAADQSSGSLAPGQSTQLRLTVRGQNLLPGTYMSLLTFQAAHHASAYDAPQLAGVALTVQPHCGLLTSTGNVSFTAVAGQSNPSMHALTLNATASCAGDPLNWQAQPSASWITLSSASGQIEGANSSISAIGVNTIGLKPGKYSGQILFLAGKNTSIVTVQLTLQSRPATSEPLMGVSPLSLNFSTIEAQANPTGQVLTITNNGGSTLQWHGAIAAWDSDWLSIAPTGGSIAPGSTGQLTVSVATTNLMPGTYSGQITLTGTNIHATPARGGPQTVAVNLLVQPPCTLAQPSARSLLFNGSLNGPDPAAQNVTLLGAGSCAWPLHWQSVIAPTAPWLTLKPSAGRLDPSTHMTDTLTVSVNTTGLPAGTYTTVVTISARDATGTVVGGNQQTFTVTLTVQ